MRKNIKIVDNFDLLDRELLHVWLDENGEETYDLSRKRARQVAQTRVVYISGGFLSSQYGGPEEGGWWYDHFTSILDVSVVVTKEEQLRAAIFHVDALLRLQMPSDLYGETSLDDVQIVIRPDRFHQSHRPDYE